MSHVLQIQLDFAAMQRDDPKLLTLKDFVMSSNQAPESPSDVLGLLQAFSEFKQGTACIHPKPCSDAQNAFKLQ